MNHKCFLFIFFVSVIPNNSYGDEPWTEIILYGFASDIGGETELGRVTSKVDVPFSDILENLDLSAMAALEHRLGNWSFIGDVFYADISAGNTKSANTMASLKVDVEVQQLLVEAFVGYKILEQELEKGRWYLDFLAGVRYNRVDIELGAEASLLGLSTSSSRDVNRDWEDAVIGLRGQYKCNKRWGATAWADAGKGDDSHSFQFIGLVDFTLVNSVKLFGGYRHYNMKYEEGAGSTNFDLDLDYTGPILGASYRF